MYKSFLTHVVALSSYRRQNVMQAMSGPVYFTKQVHSLGNISLAESTDVFSTTFT